ncbi:MAG: hypothetical protein RL702_3019, partial [Pseudomonadota bacterium]
DLGVVRAGEQPQVQIRPRREMLGRFGLTMDDVQSFLGTALRGREVGQLWDEERVFPIVLRFPESARETIEQLSEVRIPTQSGALVPLETVAEIRVGEGRSAITRDAVMFALLTWVRTKELRLAVKSEFEDLEGKEPVWRIPAERMKMGREHLVPLCAQAALIARRMVSATTGDYVFPGTHPDKPLSENTMIYALYRLGYHSRQTVHGFRGLASTWANEQLVEFGKPAMWIRKYHEDWVEMQLAHSEKNDVRSAYNAAEYLTPRRRMMQDWADFLDGRKVVDIRKGRKRAA